MPSVTRANVNMRTPIPLKVKLSRRFYEPILLEVALKKIRPPALSTSQRQPNTMNDNADSAEQTFKCFVNRLAQVCDNVRGENGATVASIAVLEEPDGVRYIIGFNNRRASQLPEVELFVKQLLAIVAKPKGRPADGSLPVQREALWHILRFNGNRVRFYLTGTADWLSKCIDDYDRRYEKTSLASEASQFRVQLSQLEDLIKFEKDKQLEEQECTVSCELARNYVSLTGLYTDFTACETLFTFIHHAQRRKFGDSISEQARDGQINSSKPWMELRHFVGRLHSYYLAVETIIRANKFWNRLFHDIKVTVIPSARVIPHPLSGRRPNAHEIMGRMSSSKEIIERHRSMAVELQKHGLDEKILTECNDLSQTHMVHAEVLVLDYLLSYLHGSSDADFWNDWRYIGSSKPTCRLCHYYFIEHPGGVQVRESHKNLYPHWRVPDVFDENAMKSTTSILNAINQRTREDAIRSLEDQISQGRVHDSNSFSKSIATETSISELVSGITNLAIPDTIEEEDGRSIAGEPDDKEEEEEEGIIVFRGRKPFPSQR